jgi:hypothetical protein
VYYNCSHGTIPELVFNELILHNLYWIYEIAVHSHVFLLDLPTNNVEVCEIYIISFWWGMGLFLVCFTVWNL